MTESPFYIEVHCQQLNHADERICGDVFLSGRFRDENRLIAVLSDGLGHGVKANVLATLTATMALNFTNEHKQSRTIAETIMNTLPTDSLKGISYSTFTIVDIEYDGEVRILEYDNPGSIVVRGPRLFSPEWEEVELESGAHAGKILRTCRFVPQKEDRILFFTDGVVQAGLGTEKFPSGWGRELVQEYIHDLIRNSPDISAKQLANKVVNMAHIHDRFSSRDDTSCAVAYFREPRKLLLCTGPPYEQDQDKELAGEVEAFQGTKIICGATTGEIIARELKLEVTDSFEFEDPDLPPPSVMEGIDLFTEGILTLSKVSQILKNYSNSAKLGKGPADLVVKLLLESDEIRFIIGTRINIAHQDPTLPVELEIRRTVVKRIAGLLENKFLKEVRLSYI